MGLKTEIVILCSVMALYGASPCAFAQQSRGKRLRQTQQKPVPKHVRKALNPDRPHNPNFHSGKKAVDDFLNGKSKTLNGYDEARLDQE